VTSICGANNFAQIEAFGRRHRNWLGKFLALSNGISSHDTFERVFQRLCPDASNAAFLPGSAAACPAGGENFAIDGKALRRSGSPANWLGPLHLVSVWATQTNFTLGHLAVDSKSNEITAIPRLWNWQLPWRKKRDAERRMNPRIVSRQVRQQGCPRARLCCLISSPRGPNPRTLRPPASRKKILYLMR
jgi:hypothetical protein